MKAYLLLENGTIFEGEAIGKTGVTIGEIVFNTSMTGYTEVLTDASYYGQIVTMTYPLIGNYGVIDADMEGKVSHVKGFIVRESCDYPSNFRCDRTIEQYLTDNNIIAMSGIDTRALTKIIRDNGTMNGAIISGNDDFDGDAMLDQIKRYSIVNAVSSVTCLGQERYEAKNGKYEVALCDYGYKKNILRELLARGCNVTIYPASASAKEILSKNPDGIMLTNGPGDPAENIKVIDELKILMKSGIPIFGICLGHQLLALASGFKTEKLKYGHRGGNHPVKVKSRNRTYITSQNHGYAVVASSVDDSIGEISHINLNDNTVEGIKYKNVPVFSVQFHPEACAGPQDTSYLFDEFISKIEKYKAGR